MGDEELIPWSEVSRLRKKAVQRARDSPASDQLDEQWSRESLCVTMLESTDGTLHFFYCVLEERIADGWAESYMDAFVKAMAESAPGEVFSDSIGIDEFRSKSSGSAH